jgi:hypothetical protein
LIGICLLYCWCFGFLYLFTFAIFYLFFWLCVSRVVQLFICFVF